MKSNPALKGNKPARKSGLLQLLVPVYNEGSNILTLFRQLQSDKIGFDSIRFVYDSDKDTTLPFIAELATEDESVVAEKNIIGKGVVNALTHGFGVSEDGPVIVLMGDNSDKLSIIPEMVEQWERGATIVSPSRYMPGGAQHGGGVLKSNLSKLAGKSLYSLGFPTSDPTNNFKLYDGAWLAAQKIESKGGFEIALELCCKAFEQGLEITQQPTVWWDRTAGESNFKLVEWLPHYLKWYLRTLTSLIFTRFSGKNA